MPSPLPVPPLHKGVSYLVREDRRVAMERLARAHSEREVAIGGGRLEVFYLYTLITQFPSMLRLEYLHM